MIGSLQAFVIVYTFSLVLSRNALFAPPGDAAELVPILIGSAAIGVAVYYMIERRRLNLLESIRLGAVFLLALSMLKISMGCVLIAKGSDFEYVVHRLPDAMRNFMFEAIFVLIGVIVTVTFFRWSHAAIKLLIIKTCLKRCHKFIRTSYKNSREYRANYNIVDNYKQRKGRHYAYDIVLKESGIEAYEYSNDIRETPCTSAFYPSLGTFLHAAMKEVIRKDIDPYRNRVHSELRAMGLQGFLKRSQELKEDPEKGLAGDNLMLKIMLDKSDATEDRKIRALYFDASTAFIEHSKLIRYCTPYFA